jgi:hypothetical protein
VNEEKKAEEEFSETCEAKPNGEGTPPDRGAERGD